MPAWLSPRVRLGVTASLIVLIACAIVLAPYLFHDDANAPDSLTSIDTAVDLPAVSPPAPSLPVLPKRVIGPQTIDRFVQSPPRPAPLSATGLDTPEGYAGSDSSPDQTADPVVDWIEQNPLAAQGIAMPLDGCGDCNSTPRQLSALSRADGPMFAPGPGGGGGGGGLAPDPASNTSGLVDNGSPSTPGSGPGDQRTSTPPDKGNPDGPNPPTHPPGNPITPPGPTGPNDPGPGDPTDPEGPDPQPPDVVLVPEPSSLIVAGAGALSFMIRARLARKRRG